MDRALIAQLVGDAQRRGLAVDGEGGLLARLTELVVRKAVFRLLGNPQAGCRAASV